MYKSKLNLEETEHAIKLVKDTFQFNLRSSLQLSRVTAPLFVKANEGINDNLNGYEVPVSFECNMDGNNEKIEIVHSLAKWKRQKLYKMGVQPGYGIYTDMNAIRTFEKLDDIHSLYVDQWDWEQVITEGERNLDYLKMIVGEIYKSIRRTEFVVCEQYPKLKPFLPEFITFITSKKLAQEYPNKTPKEREYEICKKYGAVFIIGIGGVIEGRNEIHDTRSPDYDDWRLNGDLLVWYPELKKPIELSSMGIRVNRGSLMNQLEISGNTRWLSYEYHKNIINQVYPQTIGGGIGQSRLCMILLHKLHIGEVQCSVWPNEIINECKQNNIELL